MDSELALALKAIKQKTDISVDIYDNNGKFVFSSGERINVQNINFTGDSYSDPQKQITVFNFKFKKDNYHGVLEGAGKTERNYALFITNHLENSGIQDDLLSKQDFLRSIVFGECNNMQIIKFMRKFSVPSVSCYVLQIVSDIGRSDEIVDFLDNYTINGIDTAIHLNEDNCVFVKFITSENESEYQSATDFSEIFCQSLYEETGIMATVGIGGVVKTLSDASLSYQQAVSALKISKIFNSKSHVHSYKDYILYKILEDIPQTKLMSYYNMLVDSDAKAMLADAEMIQTAEEFLDNSLNVSETSRKLYMHRNTLMYRLDKIERITGLNIKNFTDAVTFRLITLLHKVLEK